MLFKYKIYKFKSNLNKLYTFYLKERDEKQQKQLIKYIYRKEQYFI